MAIGEGLTVQQDAGKKVPAFVSVPASIQDLREAEESIPFIRSDPFASWQADDGASAFYSSEYFKIALEVFAHAE